MPASHQTAHLRVLLSPTAAAWERKNHGEKFCAQVLLLCDADLTQCIRDCYAHGISEKGKQRVLQSAMDWPRLSGEIVNMNQVSWKKGFRKCPSEIIQNQSQRGYGRILRHRPSSIGLRTSRSCAFGCNGHLYQSCARCMIIKDRISVNLGMTSTGLSQGSKGLSFDATLNPSSATNEKRQLATQVGSLGSGTLVLFSKEWS